jgi:hypothetical protein
LLVAYVAPKKRILTIISKAGNTGLFVSELLAVVAGVFLRMGRNWDILKFRQ